MKKNQKGFGVVEALIVLAVIGLLGGAGWYVMKKNKAQSKSTGTTSTANQQQETTNETKPKTEETTKSEETAKPVSSASSITVKEWGLRFKVPIGLTDIRYVVHDDSVAFFAKPTGSSVQYRTDYDKFENGHSQYASGNLYRSTESLKADGNPKQTEGKKVGNYYYYTSWAFSSLATGAACVGLYGDGDSNCQPEGKVFQLINQGDAALLNTIELVQ